MSKSGVMLVLGLLLVAGVGSAQDPDPDKGKYYTYGQLGVKKTEVVGAKIEITFRPKAENAYWCPGITIQETPKAVAVTFVRCETFKSSAVNVDAKIGKHLIRTVTIDTRGKDTYIKNGPRKYRRIYAAPKNTAAKKKAAAKKPAVKKSKPDQPATGGHVSPARGWIENKLVQPKQTKWRQRSK